ncbi:MAG TPA: CRTAC1 family protein [Bryobacteraceae bacterium]|nr:CRTAC1 family protein [Bryobacteraceae bacterium]
MPQHSIVRGRRLTSGQIGWLTLLGLSVPLSVWAWNGRGQIRFTPVNDSGLTHTHHSRQFSGKNGDVLHIFTSGGASVAVGDYDNDGLDDIFLTDSRLGGKCRLFHNDGNFKFTEVTESAGVWQGNDDRSIVADALWFDYDNDGRDDLLVARFGTPILYHNEGHGKFKDVTAASGLNQFANTIAVIAFDYDNDGYLDLLFGNYFPPVNLIELKTPHVLPNNLDNAVNGGGVTLWRNTGKGSFVDVTKKAGLDKHTGWTTDVGHGDLNNDGLQDIYLACDYGTDRMYLNNGDGTFREVTEKAIGFDTKKGMNVDIADYDNDGWLDVYVTNITDDYMKECNMLWHNNGDGTFTDVSQETGTCATLWGWGAKFGDFDNDGWQDIFVVNGLRSAGPENYIPILVNMIVKPGVDFSDVNSWPPIGNMTWSGYQKKKLFQNTGGQSFQEISQPAGVDNDKDGRGIGMADFDNDGRIDLFQTNVDQPAIFYRNVTGRVGNWVELLLSGTKSNRDAIGARIKLTAGGLTQIREVNGGNGYAGQSMRRVHFGLGDADKVTSVEIHWPSGTVDKITVPLNRLTYVREGAGIVQR